MDSTKGEVEQAAMAVAQLEAEAYVAVLHAFFARGDLTWRKEQVLVELRHALHVSDHTHRAELLRLQADPALNRLRQRLLPADVANTVSGSVRAGAKAKKRKTAAAKAPSAADVVAPLLAPGAALAAYPMPSIGVDEPVVVPAQPAASAGARATSSRKPRARPRSTSTSRAKRPKTAARPAAAQKKSSEEEEAIDKIKEQLLREKHERLLREKEQLQEQLAALASGAFSDEEEDGGEAAKSGGGEPSEDAAADKVEEPSPGAADAERVDVEGSSTGGACDAQQEGSGDGGGGGGNGGGGTASPAASNDDAKSDMDVEAE